MEALFSLLNQINPLPPDLEQHLKEIIKVKKIKKFHHLLKVGEVCENIYFVKDGLLRGYYMQDEYEMNSWFVAEGTIVVAVDSFYSQTASTQNIQALEDTVLFYISHFELQLLYKNFLSFNIHGRVLTEKSYVMSELRSRMMRLRTARERYSWLLDRHADLVARVPLKLLATFLNVTPVTVSRIRKGKGLRPMG